MKKEVVLNQKSMESVKKQTGLGVEQIILMDIEDIDKAIEKKIGKKLSYPTKFDIRLFGRGSVYLFLGRFFSFDHRKMNRTIKSMYHQTSTTIKRDYLKT